MEKIIIDKLAWVHLENRKLLATRSRGKTVCYLPGGKREPGETDTQALVREIKEELSIDLKVDTIKPLITYESPAHGKPEGVIVREACYMADFAGEMQPAAEVEEFIWLTFADRNSSLLTPAGQMMLDFLNQKNLID